MQDKVDQRFAALEKMLRTQQAELTVLRKALAYKTAAAHMFAASPETNQPRRPDTSRRKMLKRMGLAVLAGGAALGITASTYAPAEAKLSINPTSNVGAVVTRNGATVSNIPTTSNYGLIASPDDDFDFSSLDTTPSQILSGFSDFGLAGLTSSGMGLSVGVLGYNNLGYAMFGYSSKGNGVFGYSASSNSSLSGVVGSGVNSNGVFGNSGTGNGVYGSSTNGTGVRGESSFGTGVVAQTSSVNSPALTAKNAASTSGVAIQIITGGLTVSGAGVATNTAAFIHQTTNANIIAHTSTITNALCNDRPTALLFVTHNFTPTDGTATNQLNQPFGVKYRSDSGRWEIYLEDFTTQMPTDLYFNVLIINP